ncbi:MAG: DUF192 domain-containing protein [Pelatocladus maniniholoensis HA4357-MV3]|jgi:hypothetical protein|uniref:DUF192 domain-containing protein n=1 Tax=Pelatocladus maniniholoensis HA4357-MV3 TaxID=1117104 RepID=A0A9E3LWF8_9NOST|nr:DUF192 domain-containing protein [Pelatocladus maniniholoensis HA4357-MV3]
MKTTQATTTTTQTQKLDSMQLLLSILKIVGPVSGISLAVGSIALSIIATRPQQLPVSAIALVKDKKIELEVAKSPKELIHGLKFRSSLPQNRGMLFEIGKTQKVQFWMKNVKIPLDIIFLQDGVVKTVVAGASPCPKEPCPLYYSIQPVNRVLELPAGSAAKLGIKTGTIVGITKHP